MEELKGFWHSVKAILEFEILSLGDYHLSIYNICFVIMTIFAARFIVRSLEKLVKRKVSGKQWITEGKQHALIQIGTYIIYIIGFLFAVKSIGFDVTPLLIGSSALFVGLGFGLQEAFRDLISGLILLFEGDVVVGDIIQFENGIIATVKKIKLRTSKVRTRDGIVIFVPNSQLINDRVINWSHSNLHTRFSISVGVAYGSDTNLVKELLLEVAEEQQEVSNRIKPFVQFADFGSSSLDFQLVFWSEENWKIERIKSDMRFSIDRKFREYKISIPFPQRDIHIINDELKTELTKQK